MAWLPEAGEHILLHPDLARMGVFGKIRSTRDLVDTDKLINILMLYYGAVV